MSRKIELVNTTENTTEIHIDVGITEEGDILFSGQDLGSDVRKMFGDSDYEYWLSISARDKDRLLLALIEQHYSGNASVISELTELLKSKSIEYEFSSYI